MANHDIYVRRHNTENHIELSVNGKIWDDHPEDFETSIEDGDTVTLKLAPNSHLTALVGIMDYTDAKDHFISGLNESNIMMSRDHQSLRFRCSRGGYHEELHDSYFIGFKVPGDDQVYWEDPKLKMSGRHK